MRILLLFLLLSLDIFCQDSLKYTLDNSITGVYSQSNTTNKILTYNGNNSINRKHISLSILTNYNLGYNPKLYQNELSQKVNLIYDKTKYDFFCTYQLNTSVIRSIVSDNYIGIGCGIRLKKQNNKLSISYAILSQNIKYVSNPTYYHIRHSFRIKYSFDKNKFGFVTEYFYQPNIYSSKDFTLFGTTKLLYKTTKNLSFIIQDIINYNSTSKVKMIHNLTIGFSCIIK